MASLFEHDHEEEDEFVDDDDGLASTVGVPRTVEVSPDGDVDSGPACAATAAMRELERANRVREAAARAAAARAKQAAAAAAAAKTTKQPKKKPKKDAMAGIDSLLSGRSTHSVRASSSSSNPLDVFSDDDDDGVVGVGVDSNGGGVAPSDPDSDGDLADILLSPTELRRRRKASKGVGGVGKSKSDEPVSLWIPKTQSTAVTKKKKAADPAAAAAASSSASPPIESSPEDPFQFFPAKRKQQHQPTSTAPTSKKHKSNTPVNPSHAIELSDDDDDDDDRPKPAAASAAGAAGPPAHAILLDTDDDDDGGAVKPVSEMKHQSVSLSSSSSDDSLSDVDEAAIARELSDNPHLAAALKVAHSVRHHAAVNKKQIALAEQMSKVDPRSLPSPVKQPKAPPPHNSPPKQRQQPQRTRSSQLNSGLAPAPSPPVSSSSFTAPILPLASAPSSSGPAILSFWVLGPAKYRKRFKVFGSTKFGMIRDKILATLKPTPKMMTLRFDGVRIENEDTPESIGINEDDQVDIDVK